MQVTVKWTNTNTDDEGVRIYRSLSPIDAGALPAPLTTLAPHANEYIDTTVIRNTLYYYRVGIFKGTDEALSDNIITSAAPYTGPGPQALKMGNWDVGFFGVLNGTELIANDELCTRVSFTSGTLQAYNSDWIKVAYKGKVLYISKSGVRSGISTKQLYDAGLAFGTDDNGLVVPTGSTGVNQKKLVTIGSDDFKVRLFQGLPDQISAWPAMAASPAYSYLAVEPPRTEWDDIMSRLCMVASWQNSTIANDFANLSYELAPIGTGTGSLYTYPTICQPNVFGAGSAIIRGAMNAANMVYPGAFRSTYTVSAIGITLNTDVYGGQAASGTREFLWRPILELVV